MLYYYAPHGEDVNLSGYFQSEKSAEQVLHYYKECVLKEYKVPQSVAFKVGAQNRNRFVDGGSYKKIGRGLPRKGHHFAMVVVSDGNIAFYAKTDHILIGKFTVMRYGKYLKKFYPELSNEEITLFADRLDASLVAREFFLAKTPDEFENIYRNGPHSCMKSDEKWMKGKHPCRIYGAGDFELAYTLIEGEIIERCLLWPAQKRRYTIYSKSGARCSLEGLLDQAGYARSYCAVGARLFRVDIGHTANGSEKILMPYTDFEHGFAVRHDSLIGEENWDNEEYDEDECEDTSEYVWGKRQDGKAVL